MKKQDTIESRAVKIASVIMMRAGLCRHESAMMCRRLTVDETTCADCIRRWLLAKAKRELKKEGARKGATHEHHI